MDMLLTFLELLYNLLILPITLLNLTFNNSTWVADRFLTYFLSPSPQGFPFLKLTSVAQERILQHADKTDLFVLSLDSRVFKKILKAAKPSFASVDWTASHNETSVFTKETGDSHRLISYQPITKEEFDENQMSEWYQTIDLNGVKFQLHVDRDPGMGFIINYSNPQRSLEKESVQAIWDYFFDHFRALNISISTYFVPKSLVFDVFLDTRRSKFIKSLTLFQPRVFPELSYTVDILKVLEAFPVLDFLNLQWDFPEFLYQKPLKPRKIKIHFGFWLTVNCLLGMETEELEVLDCKLTCQDINLFLKDWLTGGYEHLKIVKIGRKDHEFVLDKVLEGVSWKDRDAREYRDLKFPCANFNNGRIIRRGEEMAAVATFKDIVRFYVF